jgi:hypothetical protein
MLLDPMLCGFSSGLGKEFHGVIVSGLTWLDRVTHN